MSILVTGSEGAIGQYIVSSLIDHGKNKIIRVGRTREQKKEDGNIGYWGDLTDPSLYLKIFRENEIETVIACAGKWNGLNQDEEIFKNNLLLVQNLLETVSNKIKQIVFLSSSAVYADENFDDTRSLTISPSSTYGLSKLESEREIRSWASKNNGTFTIYRPFHIVSPRERFLEGSSHVCTDFCHRILDEKKDINPRDFSDEKGIGFMWVEDLSKIIVSNLENKAFNNMTFNVGTDEERSLKELLAEIYKVAFELKLIPKEKIIFPNGPFESQSDGRFNKIKNLLGEGLVLTKFPNLIRKFISQKYL